MTMGKHVQGELFADPIQEEKAADMMAMLSQRLPRTWVRPSDVAVAVDCSVATVYEWIEAGLIVAVDYGSAERPAWKVYGPSVLAFMESRKGGRK